MQSPANGGPAATPAGSRKRDRSELERASTEQEASPGNPGLNHHHERTPVGTEEIFSTFRGVNEEPRESVNASRNHRQLNKDPFNPINPIEDTDSKIEQDNSPDSDEAEMQGASRMLNDGKGRMRQ